MKWWALAASACFIFSSVSVHGQAAAKLLTDGQNAADSGDWATAAKDFDTIITQYPSTPGIEDITIRTGFAYLHADDYLKAIDVLQKETLETVAPEFRGKALFFTGLAQFSQAHKLTDPKQSKEQYGIAEETLGKLIDYIAKDTSGKNTDLLENAMYYQSLSAYGQDKYEQTETDLNALLTKFHASTQKPDYLLLLGSVYAVQANDALNARKPDEPTTGVEAAVQKAIQTFDLVINDPDARVQANEASMREGEILYLLAQLKPEIYQKALDVFRNVLRKEDMIQVQQTHIDDLRKQQANDLQNGGVATVGNMRALILDREVARLKELKEGDDPIIQALIRMAESYIGLKEADEARTILRRLHGVKLSDDQQKEVDFQLLYSYTLGGQAVKADAALTDYLAKHPGDPQADSISVQIADALMKRKPPDYQGALHQAQRSLQDFPNGKHVDAAVTLESKALTELGRIDEASHVIDDFLKAHSDNPLAYAMKVTQGEGQMNSGKFADALATFDAVRKNPKAGAFQASADAYYIQVLNNPLVHRYADVVAEAKNFETQYPKDNALSSVEVIAATAMVKLNDPGAVAALQAVSKQFGADHPEVGSYALYNVVTVYQQQNKPDLMLQAATDLRTQYPTSYALISAANDLAMAALEKAKKFDQAVALYQPLTSVSDKLVASAAQNKVGTIWYDAAKAMGNYQSLSAEVGRPEAEKRLQASEQAFVATLKTFYDQSDAVGDAFEGLITDGLLRVRWGLQTEADLEGYLTKQCADIADPAMQTHLELAKAGLVFYTKNGHLQDAAALARFDKAISASAGLHLTTQEADHYGTLLIGANRYPDAMKVFQNLLADAAMNQVVKLAEGYYGIAAVYLAQNDYANAKAWIGRMFALPGSAAWSKHFNDAQLAMAEINEQSSDPADVAAAMAAYASTMISPPAGAENQAKAMLGYGRILEKQGHAVKAPNQADIQYATHYYEQVDLFYGGALPQESAEGLLLAGQAKLKAGDAVGAKADFDKMRSAYAKTAPDWVAKIPAGN